MTSQVGAAVVAARMIGFSPVDTTVSIGLDSMHVALLLRPRPIDLQPVTARAERLEGGAVRERALFHREAVPGLVGVSRQELRDMPVLAEADPLRSLQAVPGVVATHDLSARLHVQGGGPDQTLFLLDGARVFAPYHMFGIFGAFNADAIGRVEMYRGAIPARRGNGMSAVVELEHRGLGSDDLILEGGLGMLGARALFGGRSGTNTSWMVAARRTHADLVLDRFQDREFPYAFWDANARVSTRPTEAIRLRASAFASADRFRLFLERASDEMRSSWSNAASSVQMDWTLSPTNAIGGVLWFSRYSGEIAVGGGTEVPASSNEVSIIGLRLSDVWTAEEMGLRTGLEVEIGNVDLLGSSRTGGLVQGEFRDDHRAAAAYAEGEFWFGRTRIAPGIRIEFYPGAAGVLVAPRLFARYHFLPEIALGLGISRSHQALSTLRDDRFALPGPPFWFVQSGERPVSSSDAVFLAIEGWFAEGWSLAWNAYGRRFADVPRWRPIGTRDLTGLAFDDGSSIGLDLSVRRHRGRLTGWIAYGLSRTRYSESETSTDYRPPWDRLHSFDGALFLELGRGASGSLRARYGSGTPFWPQVGVYPMGRLDALAGELNFAGTQPSWGSEQMSMPQYFRIDAALRWPFQWRGAEITPHLSLLNLTGRQNVLHYRLVDLRDGDAPRLLPELQLPLPAAFPSLGIDVRF